MPNIFGSDLEESISATATKHESIFAGDGDDDLYFFWKDTTDQFFGEGGHDYLYLLSPTWKGGKSYKVFSEVQFDGGDGFDTVLFGFSSTKANTTIKMAKLKAKLTDVEQTGLSLSFSKPGAKAKVIGTTGDDFVVISGKSNAKISISTGKGDDVVSLGTTGFAKDIKIKTGAGNDQVATGRSAPGAKINTGSGDDAVYSDGRSRETIKLGTGDDLVWFTDVVKKSSTVTLGEGFDTVRIDLSFATVASVKIVDFNEGEDVFQFDEGTSFIFGDESGDSEDQVVVDNDQGKIYYESTTIVDFGREMELTVDNFEFV